MAIVKSDFTSIEVSWKKFTLVELKGLANYVITYSVTTLVRKRQLGGTITVPWTENSVIIRHLNPGAQYDVTVTTSTSARMSSKCSLQ